MARLFKVKRLEVEKAVHVARSEIYRQMLGVELSNFKLKVAGMQRKIAVTRTAIPLALLALPVAGFLLARRGRTPFRGFAALLGWQLVRRLRPLWKLFLLRLLQPR